MHEAEHVYVEDEIRTRLAADLPAWYFADGHICRRYRTGGWKSSLMVAGAVGHLAEAAWHHPDLLVSYPGVVVRLTTHSAGGVTDKDFALARRIEGFLTWQPGEADGGLTGTPADQVYLRPD
jgi:4a-hydroxytetrahydrobiopterin dehydratase